MRLLVLTFLLIAIHVMPAPAQRFQWPDRAENLQVLDADTDASKLSSIMRGFATSLGVRCTHCHVGEDGAPLGSLDFVSDEKPTKSTAREMLRMLADINDRLENIEPSGPKRVNIWCHTCHAGRPRPMTLPEELGEVVALEGSAAALEHYAELRKGFHGRGAYDFGVGSLSAFGYELLDQGDVEGALNAFALNVEHFPASANTYVDLAQATLANGNRARAIELYRKALELNPRLRSVREKLEELEGD